MTDYTKTYDFASKDGLPIGNPGKIIRGSEFDTEFNNIQTASATKSNTISPAFTGTVGVTGNITVTGTVDGRDVATDGTKLDTVESNADVTDVTNVTAAGALMDSEVTNLAQVKAFDSANYATAAQGTKADAALPKAGGAMTGAITTNSTFDGRDVAADGTKLDTVETNADVTNTTNVTASGALMDSEVTNLAQVKAFDSTDYATAAQGTKADAALPKVGGAVTGPITSTSTFDGRDVSADGTKLDTIATNADVTNTTNVVASLSSGTGISISGAGQVSNTLPDQTVVLTQGGATTISGTYPNFTISSTNTAYTNADVDTHLNTSTATASQVLSWTGADYDWVSTSSAPNFQTVTDTGNTTTNSITVAGLISSAGMGITGNITVTGTVDGRNISTDGTKLDGIESGATADQTALQIKTAYESNINTNAFDDAEQTKLSGIETGADVTDATNVSAAGALMKSGGAMTGPITTNSTFDGRNVSVDGTKLDGIEAGATADQTAAQIKTAYESNANTNAFTDAEKTKLTGIEAGANVTDTANVTAAGALMDSELASIASVKALNQGVATTNSPSFVDLTLSGDPVYRNVTANIASADVTFSTAVPSGGADGDIWYQY